MQGNEYNTIVRDFKTDFKNYINTHEDLPELQPNPSTPLNPNPKQPTRVFVHPVDPVAANDNALPAFFFGYGAARLNGENVGTGYQGETISIIINAVVGIIAGTTVVDDVDITDITDSAAVIHQAVRDFVLNKTTVVDMEDGMPISPTMEFRLAGVDTDAQGISEREFMTFTIEIDWAYPAYVE